MNSKRKHKLVKIEGSTKLRFVKTTAAAVNRPYRPAVPGAAATALLNGATFVKRRDTHSPPKLLQSRHEQRRRDPEKKA